MFTIFGVARETLPGGTVMLVNAIGLMQLPDQVVVQSLGTSVTTFACGRGRILTDAGPTYTANVVFHNHFANVDFGNVGQTGITLFVYVDDVIAMTLQVKGSVALVVPLDSRRHHKIITGSSINGEATNVWAACTEPVNSVK